MRKTRFLALTLAVVLVLMGAGYAFWTEALNINATVNTGELNYKFDNVDFNAGPNEIPYGGRHVSGSAKASGDGYALDLVFTNLYPGATASVSFCIENIGSIDLKIEDFEFIGDDPNLEELVVIDGEDRISIADYFAGLEETFIEVGDSICEEVVFSVNKCATEDEFAELANFDFSIKAVVKQYNDDGSCDEPAVEDPECTGLNWSELRLTKCPEGSSTYSTEEEEYEIDGQGRKMRYLNGTVYAVYSNEISEVIRTFEDIRLWTDSDPISVKHDRFEIKISNVNGGLYVEELE